MPNNKQKKTVFSVSKKYLKVYDILDKVPNKSEFICQAIIALAENNTSSITDDELQVRIKKAMQDIISDRDIVIAKAGTSIEVPDPTKVPKKDTLTSEPIDPDSEDIRRIVGQW